MVEVYARLVRLGRKTIEQVPQSLREEVITLLKDSGDYKDNE